MLDCKSLPRLAFKNFVSRGYIFVTLAWNVPSKVDD